MEINANVNLTVQISGGPAISTAWTIAADAFDRATFKIPKNTAKLDVPLQPSGGDKVLLLVITSIKYTEKVTFKLDPGNPDFKLTQPQLISGGDMVNTLSKTPSTVTFKNDGPDDVTVDLFVLRRA